MPMSTATRERAGGANRRTPSTTARTKRRERQVPSGSPKSAAPAPPAAQLLRDRKQ